MNIFKTLIRSTLVLGLAIGCVRSAVAAPAAEANPSIPAVIQTGFSLFAKGGADIALDAWRKGGLAEGDNRAGAQANFFKQLDLAIGNYKSFELVEAKAISQSSRIIYLAINFERGVIYARFLLYKTDKAWVVQQMDFSTRPDVIMPWLAFAESNQGQF